MKIVYLGNFNISHSVETSVAAALTCLGNEVVKIQSDAISFFSALLNRITSEDPDLVLFSKAPVPNCGILIKRLRQLDITTACWHWDLYHGCMGRESEVWPQHDCDFMFTTDGGNSVKFQTGDTLEFWLPSAVNHLEAVAQPPDYQYDVGFVGHRNSKFQPGREELVDFLEGQYGDAFCYTGNTFGLKLNKWLSQVRVVVGDCHPSANGYYWSDRIYEVIGRGGFILHPEVEGLNSHFTPHLHYDTYIRGDFEGLKSKIDYYLDFPSIRSNIRDDGHKHCIEHHTYTQRCRTLLNVVRPSCH